MDLSAEPSSTCGQRSIPAQDGDHKSLRGMILKFLFLQKMIYASAYRFVSRKGYPSVTLIMREFLPLTRKINKTVAPRLPSPLPSSENHIKKMSSFFHIFLFLSDFSIQTLFFYYFLPILILLFFSFFLNIFCYIMYNEKKSKFK